MLSTQEKLGEKCIFSERNFQFRPFGINIEIRHFVTIYLFSPLNLCVLRRWSQLSGSRGVTTGCEGFGEVGDATGRQKPEADTSWNTSCARFQTFCHFRISPHPPPTHDHQPKPTSLSRHNKFHWSFSTHPPFLSLKLVSCMLFCFPWRSICSLQM